MRLVRLSKLEQEYNVNNKLYGLVGGENPTGSIKDVTVRQMLLKYKEEGKLTNGCTIIEATSGNTGIALSYYQKEFNYKCLIVMPKSMSMQRRQMIQQYGAELCLLDGGMEECEKEAELISSKIPNSFVFGQFDCLYNRFAHYNVTGPLIYKECKDIDILVAGIGTGGTISGTSKYLKEQNANILSIGVEPYESPLLTKGVASPHLIQGIGANFIPNTLDKELIDKIEDVEGLKAIDCASKIRYIEQLDVGISSGAAVLGAIQYLKNNSITNKNVVIILPDRGDRYTW